jgi:hypothetical protein
LLCHYRPGQGRAHHQNIIFWHPSVFPLVPSSSALMMDAAVKYASVGLHHPTWVQSRQEIRIYKIICNTCTCTLDSRLRTVFPLLIFYSVTGTPKSV